MSLGMQKVDFVSNGTTDMDATVDFKSDIIELSRSSEVSLFHERVGMNGAPDVGLEVSDDGVRFVELDFSVLRISTTLATIQLEILPYRYIRLNFVSRINNAGTFRSSINIVQDA